MESPLSLTLLSMKFYPGTIRRLCFPSHCFLFPHQKTVAWRRPKLCHVIQQWIQIWSCFYQVLEWKCEAFRDLERKANSHTVLNSSRKVFLFSVSSVPVTLRAESHWSPVFSRLKRHYTAIVNEEGESADWICPLMISCCSAFFVHFPCFSP